MRRDTLPGMRELAEQLKQIAVRLPIPNLEKAERWAEGETEGNRSQMIRKLVDEAIRAREARK